MMIGLIRIIKLVCWFGLFCWLVEWLIKLTGLIKFFCLQPQTKRSSNGRRPALSNLLTFAPSQIIYLFSSIIHLPSSFVCHFLNFLTPRFLTQFISHRLCRWVFKRFYRYREGILDGCVSDRCRRLMNWYKKEFLHIFFQSVGMRQKNNHPQTWPRQTRYLQMMNRSSGHQNRQIR